MNEDIARVIAEGFNELLWKEREKLGYNVNGRISLGFISESVKKGGFSLGESTSVTCCYNSRGKQYHLFTEYSRGCNELIRIVTYRLFVLANNRDIFNMLVKDEYTGQ